jgi:hypothetical protein
MMNARQRAYSRSTARWSVPLTSCSASLSRTPAAAAATKRAHLLKVMLVARLHTRSSWHGGLHAGPITGAPHPVHPATSHSVGHTVVLRTETGARDARRQNTTKKHQKATPHRSTSGRHVVSARTRTRSSLQAHAKSWLLSRWRGDEDTASPRADFPTGHRHDSSGRASCTRDRPRSLVGGRRGHARGRADGGTVSLSGFTTSTLTKLMRAQRALFHFTYLINHSCNRHQ